VNPFRQVPGDRPLAVRSTAIAVAVALVVAALGSALFTVVLHDTLSSGLQTFVLFGTLAGLSAGVLAWEIAASRSCPRCGAENAPGSAVCAGCGYDVRTRPRYACTEGHAVAYEAGLCDCGRRLLPLEAPGIARQVLHAVWFAVAFFVLFLALQLLLTVLAR
jgi:hypothetical protein